MKTGMLTAVPGVRRAGFRLTSFWILAVCSGCGGESRPPRTQEELMGLRIRANERRSEKIDGYFQQFVDRLKADMDRAATGSTPAPTTDVLIISGGGDWGAFGAGFLKGWGKVPPGPMARPQFDFVTGVSTGALIAPFAFLGDDESILRIESLYRNPKTDWVRHRGWLYFLPNNISFAEVPGLEREVREAMDLTLVRRIADASDAGRYLGVNTTNLDDGTACGWNLGEEARRAVAEQNPERMQQILLASAGIPAAFPHRIIDDEMYVDGCVTANIMYGGALRRDQTIEATWASRFPGVKMPKLRFWVIFHNQLRTPPSVTRPAWPAIVARSLELATRSATITAIRHLHAMAEISRLKYGADVEVRTVAIPDDWVPPVPGVFVKETMNNLADLGERMGADPASWQTEAP